jgi:hypothetical protein
MPILDHPDPLPCPFPCPLRTPSSSTSLHEKAPKNPFLLLPRGSCAPLPPLSLLPPAFVTMSVLGDAHTRQRHHPAAGATIVVKMFWIGRPLYTPSASNRRTFLGFQGEVVLIFKELKPTRKRRRGESMWLARGWAATAAGTIGGGVGAGVGCCVIPPCEGPGFCHY